MLYYFKRYLHVTYVLITSQISCPVPNWKKIWDRNRNPDDLGKGRGNLRPESIPTTCSTNNK
jgi:hypothetical protein